MTITRPDASEDTLTTQTAPAGLVVDLSTRSTLSGIGDLAAAIGLRRLVTTTEAIPREGEDPILRAAAVAVIANPWIGKGTDADLSAASRRTAPLLAKLLTDRLLHMLGGAERILAFGKAALVGTRGEIEHASALIHTPYFGNLMREALDGTSILCFADGTAEPGSSIRVPMWHKTAASTRDYYQTLEVALPDAPHRDEIAVVAAASTGPRPYPRIGDRSTDRHVTSDILKGIEL